MAVTEFQRQVCRVIARRLRESETGYVAGGVALSEAVSSGRISRDIDLFHDTQEAVESAWKQDAVHLREAGFEIRIVRDIAGFKEAIVRQADREVLVQWTRDSAFRFFPLQADDLFGFTLHPVDLATNKALAMAGRLEPRDWVDVLNCHDRIQPFGYLVWAACGKDPGFNPRSLLEEARRGGRYTQVEINELSFSGAVPNARELGEKWHRVLREADAVIESLSGCEIGACVLETDGSLCRMAPDVLYRAVREGRVRFRSGSLRGVLPMVSPKPV